MGKFSYLVSKINEAAIDQDPFQHTIISDFFSPAHFDQIVNSQQIRAKPFSSNREVVDGLINLGYKPEPFPGCITNIEEYIAFADGAKSFNKKLIKGYGRDIIEGYGLTMRMHDVRDGFLRELLDFLNGEEFQTCLRQKFDVEDNVYIETAYQKNLMHYQISPHCDTSKKALTYMVNIYNVDDCAQMEMHTHLLRFKPEYQYLYDVWRDTELDPVWVPWEWCESVKQTNTNNSISIFKPSYDTLHAVRVSEEHFSHQRNQIYGNLWYPQAKKTQRKSWQALDRVGGSFDRLSRLEKIRQYASTAAHSLIK